MKLVPASSWQEGYHVNWYFFHYISNLPCFVYVEGQGEGRKPLCCFQFSLKKNGKPVITYLLSLNLAPVLYLFPFMILGFVISRHMIFCKSKKFLFCLWSVDLDFYSGGK